MDNSEVIFWGLFSNGFSFFTICAVFLTDIKNNFTSLDTCQLTGSEYAERGATTGSQRKGPVGALNFNPHRAAYMQVITVLVVDQQARTEAPPVHQGVKSTGHQSSRPRERGVRAPEGGRLGTVNDVFLVLFLSGVAALKGLRV